MSEYADRSSKQKSSPSHQPPIAHEQDQQLENHADTVDFFKMNIEALPLKPEAVLRLQRTIGNQEVQRLLNTGDIKPPPALNGLPALAGITPSPTLTQPAPSPTLAMRDRILARDYSPTDTNGITSPSPALQMRAALQTLPTTHNIQRDIKGSRTFGSGKLEIDFTKTEGAVAGDQAVESGTITFTPSKYARKSKAIHMIQIVRTTDTSGPKEKDYVWTGAEAPRNKMMTGRNRIKNVAPGWYVDQVAGELKKRKKKADPEQKPYYDKTGMPVPGQNKIGKTGKPPVPATLDDAPGSNIPLKFRFNTSVKGDDNGVFYGTVLWGFETYHDKAGVAKIKGEYKSFRSWPGATLKAAVKKFNKYYQNPGAKGAPTK